MDSLVNQLARELTDAIAAAMANDVRVEACREKARAAGLDMSVALEAVISFSDRANADKTVSALARKPPRPTFEMSANDRRFLKSLRISAEDPAEKEVE